MTPPLTARAILSRRLGRALGPLSAMPRDLRRALYLLALELQRQVNPIRATGGIRRNSKGR